MKKIDQKQKIAAFDVYLNGYRITTVFKSSNLTVDEVKNILVNKEMFDEDIVVELLG